MSKFRDAITREAIAWEPRKFSLGDKVKFLSGYGFSSGERGFIIGFRKATKRYIVKMSTGKYKGKIEYANSRWMVKV